MSIFRKKTAFFVSDMDKFLLGFDQSHSLSLSQEQEKLNSERIAYLRDKEKNPDLAQEALWDF